MLTSSYINSRYQKYGIVEPIDQNKFLPIMFTDVDIAMVNALRRIYTSEIDTLAFGSDNIQIEYNKSQYHREVLIDRMGFITIDTDFVVKNRLDPEDLVFVIGDGDRPLKNNTQTIIKIKIHDHLSVSYKGEPHNIKDICPFNSLLMTLKPTEEIRIIMHPSFGSGRQHPRWQSSVTMYKFASANDLLVSPQNIVESNPEQMGYVGHEDKKPKAIILTIESVGKSASINVLKRGIQLLKGKIEHLKSDLLLPKPTLSTIEFIPSIPNLVKLIIPNEDHTIGRVLETVCLNKLIQLTAEIPNGLMESLSGYRKPHPLDNYIELIIRIPMEQLSFPNKQYDHLMPPLRLIIFAMDDVVKLCDNLIQDVSRDSINK